MFLGKLASINVVTPLTTLRVLGSNYYCWADSALQGQRSNQYTTKLCMDEKDILDMKNKGLHKPSGLVSTVCAL